MKYAVGDLYPVWWETPEWWQKRSMSSARTRYSWAPEKHESVADWHRLQDEWAMQNCVFYVTQRKGPPESNMRVAVVSGPIGFYGKLYQHGNAVFFGARRDTKQDAATDADLAADLIEQGGFTGMIHAYRSLA